MVASDRRRCEAGLLGGGGIGINPDLVDFFLNESVLVATGDDGGGDDTTSDHLNFAMVCANLTCCISEGRGGEDDMT